MLHPLVQGILEKRLLWPSIRLLIVYLLGNYSLFYHFLEYRGCSELGVGKNIWVKLDGKWDEPPPTVFATRFRVTNSSRAFQDNHSLPYNPYFFGFKQMLPLRTFKNSALNFMYLRPVYTSDQNLTLMPRKAVMGNFCQITVMEKNENFQQNAYFV